MTLRTIALATTLAGLLGIAWAQTDRLSPAEARAALAELEADRPVKDSSRRDDAEYAAVFAAQDTLYIISRMKLIGDLWRAEPTAPELAELMPSRWKEHRRVRGFDLEGEVEAFAAAQPHATQAIASGWHEVAQRDMAAAARDAEKALAVAQAFIDRFPEDARGASLLYQAVRSREGNDKVEAFDQILKKWPDSPIAKRVSAERRRAEGVGKPFELSFRDWLTGRDLTMADFKGKVVVIDFWATWCGPCKADLPHVKELYAAYHDSGLEIIGVSLDHTPEKGGGEALTKYCTANDLTWPQYYQGNYWDSEFSQSWGIFSIPAVFVVDRQGNLRSTDARGKLDDLIPKLLAEPGA